MASKRTILVVDDEPDVVKSVQDLLRLEYRVLGATRASEGFKILQTEEVHVVMSDQRMPEMTGVQFLHQVRGEHPESIRLLFTGYADIRAVIDAINQGNIYRYITKPWDPDELMAVIREAVDRYDLLVERKRLSDELQQKAASLEAANVELQTANRLKEDFIQVASHELRTPLTILGGLTNLAQRVATQPPLSDYLHRIHGAGQRLQHLVDQLLCMLAAGTFHRPLSRAPVKIADLMTHAADDVRPFADMRKLALVVESSPDAGTMELDAAKVRDALNHLLLNAIKFTPDGGRIAIGARRDADGTLHIAVSDTGVGISAEARARLFEPFFTEFDVSHHTSGQFEFGRRGLGLGLCVVKAWAQMHGGSVDVQSEVGKGTTVTLTLPAAALVVASDEAENGTGSVAEPAITGAQLPPAPLATDGVQLPPAVVACPTPAGAER